MKLVLTAGLALLLLGSPAVYAQYQENHQGEVRGIPHWGKGDRVPDEYRHGQYEVSDWRGMHLRRPPRGQHWVHVGDRFILLSDKNGAVVDLRIGEH